MHTHTYSCTPTHSQTHSLTHPYPWAMSAKPCTASRSLLIWVSRHSATCSAWCTSSCSFCRQQHTVSIATKGSIQTGIVQNFYFSSVQDCICALRKAHMRSTPSLRSFPSTVFKMVPRFVWLTLALLPCPSVDYLSLSYSSQTFQDHEQKCRFQNYSHKIQTH